MKRMSVVLVFGISVLAVVTLIVVRELSRYQVSLALPAASNLVVGTPFQIQGRDAGTIADVYPQEGHAVVRLAVDRAYAPFHDGTTARIRWKSVLGERVLEVLPGALPNPALPNGALIVGTIAPVEFENVLATLDPATRAHLDSMVQQLNETVDGHQQDLNQTLRTAGPAVEAVGRVLDNIGSDGPAITAVVDRLNQLTAVVAARRGDVSGTIEQLARTGTELAQRRAQLRDTLRELPSTLSQVRQTLDRVPSATDATVPLLDELEPATRQLPSVADNLLPLLRTLRPASHDLGPTLQSAESLLSRTPDLLDAAHDVFPPITDALGSSQNAVNFLRPYTPELAGFFTNWGSFAAPVDANGHYNRVFSPQGASTLTNNPGVLPPGMTMVRAPLPGSLEGQPWVDATGSGIR